MHADKKKKSPPETCPLAKGQGKGKLNKADNFGVITALFQPITINKQKL